jgi:hypothetical protein
MGPVVLTSVTAAAATAVTEVRRRISSRPSSVAPDDTVLEPGEATGSP